MVKHPGWRTAVLRSVTVLAAFVLLATSCSDSDDQSAPATSTTQPGTASGVVTGTRSAGDSGAVSVSLSQGEAFVTVAAVVPVLEGRPLDAQAISEIVNRLPEWLPDENDRTEFNRPAETLPPPRAGDTMDVTFPAPTDATPPEIVAGPLEVLRFQPDGDVGLAPFVSVTFNQPMVPLGTVAQVDASNVPATITPELPGRWQWIGTRTLRFEHDPTVFDRLPMATHYTVEIPAGTKSASGGVLADAVKWEFATPAPSATWLSPQHSSLPLEPVFLASFDQRVDPEGTLAAIRLSAGGAERQLRMATAAEIEADDIVGPRVEQMTDGTWIAFRAVDAFEPDQAIEIEIGPRIPSAEGPDTTDRVTDYQAHTYEPLRIVRQSCTSSDRCSPGWGMGVSFNNTLDPESIKPADITIDPEIPGAMISVNWSEIGIRGETAGDTTYKVTIPGTLADEFGQTLGDDADLEFVIGPATPLIEQVDQALITLDPLADSQTFPVVVRNHDNLRVRIYDVDPEDWQSFQTHLESRWENDNRLPPPNFPLLSDKVISTGAVDNLRQEVRIDLEPVLGGGHGQVVVRIDGTGRFADLGPRDDRFWDNGPIEVWVQATDIGLDMLSDNETGYAWTTDLGTGVPLAGVEVTAGSGSSVTTSSDGLVSFALTTASVRVLVARLGDDVAISPTYAAKNVIPDQTIWYVADDRGMYRPGETVRVKGWVRSLSVSDGGRLEYPSPNEIFTYNIRDAFGNEIDSGRVTPDAWGGFDLSIDIPEGTTLGQAWVEFNRPADRNYGYYNHSLRIEEFRRPEFEVTTRPESPGPYFTDEPATVAVEASYFSGGPLPNAPVGWRVTTAPGSYSPPGWSDFVFGEWTPWWIFNDYGYGYGLEPGYRGGFDRGFGYEPDVEREVETFSGSTDASGTHYLQMNFAGDGDGLPTSVTAEASVTDVNRQVWTDRSDLLVHPASLYVGIRSTRTFVKAGESLDVEAIVTDVDGDSVSGRGFTVTAERLVSRYVDGKWTEVAVDTQTCETASADGPVTCTFAMDVGGQWQLRAEVVDDSGRLSRSEMTRWVSGADAVVSRSLELENIELIPDRSDYAVGDTAEILVQSPFGPATGLAVWGSGGIDTTHVFTIDGADAVIRIPVAESDVPGISVQVELVGSVARVADDGTPLPDVAPRPAFATGRIDLRVPPASRTLHVVATPAADTVVPGAATSVDVEVVDASGSPVTDANMMVVVVDEAILALSGYELLDPLEVFYRSNANWFGTYRARGSILLADPQEMIDAFKSGGAPASTIVARAPEESGVRSVAPVADSAAYAYDLDADEAGGDGGLNRAGSSPIDVRTNFDALAAFEPDVVTDADGKATVSFDLPDSLTRYRVMVVAVAGTDNFGTGESTITARLPLQVRPSAPRFLNFGDEFELPIVVQNLTATDTEVNVVLETSNLEVIGSSGLAVNVPANDRVEVRFPVRTQSAGIARFRAAAVGGGDSDAAVVSLPVYTPATAEAFATYGVIDDGSTLQPLLAPEGVFPQFGGLEVNTSSTALQALTDAVVYLNEYGYRSADAFASRILALSALRDVLDAFQAEGVPTKAAMESTIRADIVSLSALQNYDGGFGTWRRGQESSPFRSLQAIHALVEAKANGFSVDSEVMAKGLSYAFNIESHIPVQWSRATKDMLIAYSLNVRHQGGDTDAVKARALWRRAGSSLGFDALAWIWPVVSDADIEAEIARTFANRVTETPGAATFVTSYGEDDYLILNSDRRTDGIVLRSLIEMDPATDLIPKVVAGLIGNQVKGRWNNVQENAFILLALNDYFNTFEDVDPDFVARVWLGDLYAAEHRFEGRSIDRAETLIPMSELIESGDSNVIIAKDGPGRLYYRLGLRYAPTDLTLDPLDKGFVVQRSYEGVDDPDDVWLDSDGIWHVKAGAEVRVRITMVNDSRRTNMALIDPLPAGLEPLNPALSNIGEIPPEEFDGDSIANSRWWGPWYNHQNLRDDRAEVFSSYLWAGTHQYVYVARATTPGTFVVPPSRAEEIYAPEVFGRSASTIMIVEDPASLS